MTSYKADNNPEAVQHLVQTLGKSVSNFGVLGCFKFKGTVKSQAEARLG